VINDWNFETRYDNLSYYSISKLQDGYKECGVSTIQPNMNSYIHR